MRAFFAILLTIITTQALALGASYSTAFERELLTIIARHPRYVWGGAETEAKGLDCSGFIFLAARRAGMPVIRVTSAQMAQGRGGWIGRDIAFRDSAELDIIWWTFKPERPLGHLGVLIRHPVYKTPSVTHASSTRGVVVDFIQGPLLRDLSKTRRLTIGDP